MSIKLVARDKEVLFGYSTNVYVKEGKEYIDPEKVTFSAKGAVSVDENGFVIATGKGNGKVSATYNGETANIKISVYENKDIKYVGHRGAQPLTEDEICVPNTKTAFEIGAKRNTYGVETDLRVSPDHVFYCHHDGEVTFTPMNFVESEFKRKKITADNVNNIDFSVLKKLHIYWDNGDRRDLTKIALLVDYLKVCKKYKKKCVLEFKWTNGITDADQSNVEEVVQIVKECQMYENVFFMTSMRPCLDFIRSKHKDAAMQLLTGIKMTNMDSVNWCVENKASFDAYFPCITQEQIDTIHANHLYVNAWTINDKKDADKMIEMGVDMITSDLLQGEENE